MTIKIKLPHTKTRSKPPTKLNTVMLKDRGGGKRTT